MFSHVMIGTNDLDRAKTFYDAALGALGVREGNLGKLYLAYMRDPDGNKLCALHRM